MAYALYTPPGWDGETPLPLVLLLHGGGDDERVLGEHPEVAEQLDAWIEAGRLPPLLLAAPDGERGFWMNWHDGTHAYQDWVLEDLVAAVRERHPVVPGRQGLHVVGPSMGGAGTIFLALDHREQLASATVVSAPVFDADTTVRFLRVAKLFGVPTGKIWGPVDRDEIERNNPFAQFDAPASLRGMRLSLVVGTEDRRGIRRQSGAFHDHLEAHDVPHDYIVYEGAHRWTDWAEILPVALCRQLRPDTCTLPAPTEGQTDYTLQ